MAVTVDYLVVYSGDKALMDLLTATLENALEGVDDELSDEDELTPPITIRHTKTRAGGQQICGFSVEFDTEEEQMGALIDDFSDSVSGLTDDGIEHLLKLNDPHLRRTLRDYAEEIFEIEMKLREALSLIFVDAYGEDFYDLLKDTNVRFSPPNAERMREYHENQFFFMLFRHYKEINKRSPITEERYVEFLDNLEEEIVLIEELRNCVAHNRSIPEKAIADYDSAKNRLLAEIDELLNQ